jgi:hypothetical protein
MTRDVFIEFLSKASMSSLAFARRYVENDLPDTLRYHVVLNQSYDGKAETAERVYPEDDGREYASLAAAAVADVLLRDGRCPEWIDVAVEAQADDHTRMRLLCCGRYTEDDSRMYYTRQGTGPFGIKSPNLPPGYQEGTKFSVPKVQPCAAPNGGPGTLFGNAETSEGPPSVS